MKILTFNLWGILGPAERQPVLLRALRQIDADLLCLQEAADPSLLEQLPDYPARLRAEAGNLAILSRYPILSHRVVTYAAASPLETYCRQALLAQLQVGETPLWVVTTHLSWRAEDEPTRQAQAEELLALVGPLGENVLLSGDFNTEPDHPPVRRLREAGFVDLFAELHSKEPGITWDNANPFIQSHSARFPDRRIDYLFLHANALRRFAVRRCEVVGRTPSPEGLFPSDHYGVLADLQR